MKSCFGTTVAPIQRTALLIDSAEAPCSAAVVTAPEVEQRQGISMCLVSEGLETKRTRTQGTLTFWLLEVSGTSLQRTDRF